MSAGTLRTLPELVVSLLGDGEFLVANPFVRTYAVVDGGALEVLSLLRQEHADVENRFAGRSFRAVDATQSPFLDGLL
jgi:preprotein translocase subunit SecA